MGIENRRVIHQGGMKNFEVVVEGFISSYIEAKNAKDAIRKCCGQLDWVRGLEIGSSKYACATDEKSGLTSEFIIKITGSGIRFTPLGKEE